MKVTKVYALYTAHENQIIYCHSKEDKSPTSQFTRDYLHGEQNLTFFYGRPKQMFKILGRVENPGKKKDGSVFS